MPAPWLSLASLKPKPDLVSRKQLVIEALKLKEIIEDITGV